MKMINTIKKWWKTRQKRRQVVFWGTATFRSTFIDSENSYTHVVYYYENGDKTKRWTKVKSNDDFWASQHSSVFLTQQQWVNQRTVPDFFEFSKEAKDRGHTSLKDNTSKEGKLIVFPGGRTD